MKSSLLRMIAVLAAALMVLAGASSAMAASGDWAGTQISLEWADASGNQMVSFAAPTETLEGAFWAYVPGDAMNQLTLRILHPGHAYLYTPGDGALLEGIQDAGTTLDGPFLSIMQQDPETGVQEELRLYISTQTAQPDYPVYPEELVIVPEEPVIVPEEPVVVPEEPVIVPEDPVIVPEEPAVVPEELAAVPEEPVIVPEEPVVVPEEPVIVPEEPVIVPEEPVIVPFPWMREI